MNRPNFIIRPARMQDAPAIAVAVAMAIGDEQTLRGYCGDDYLSVLTAIAQREGTQYSWQHAIVAQCDDKVVGAVVGYDGALLEQLREGTFAVLRQLISRTPKLANETEAGEYYLDSIAVMPEYQGVGIGSALIDAFCKRALAQGHKQVGLIVDFDNPTAERLYTSQGFKRIGKRLFFEHKMWHLQRQIVE